MFQGASNTAIEYFLLMRDDVNGDRLVYYDKRGTRFETSIQRETVEAALKIFDGKPKAIRRSSGGLIMAEPYQLILLDPNRPNASKEPAIRIKVRFKEFCRDKGGNVNFEDYQINTKVVSLDEIFDPFSFNLSGQQRFVLDFGRGMIPVYVFHYDTDPLGNALAYFIEINALKRSLTGKAGDTFIMRTYRVARQTLRYARDLRDDGVSEFDAALENYQRMLDAGLSPIPEGFAAGDPIEVSLPQTHQGLRRFLRDHMGFKDSESHSTTVKAALPFSESNPGAELLPFGVLEKENLQPAFPKVMFLRS